MAYTLTAIVGPKRLLARNAALPGAILVELRQGLALIPMTDTLLDALTNGHSNDTLKSSKPPGGLDEVLAACSATGIVVFIEAEYFGGVGHQRAAVWEAGRLRARR